jgi:hypothetical protein
VCSFSCGTLRFVVSLEEDLTVRAKTTEMKITDFSSGSYATVFRDEVHLHYLSTFHLHYTIESMPFCNHPLEHVTEVLKDALEYQTIYIPHLSKPHKLLSSDGGFGWHVSPHVISFFSHAIYIGSYLYSSF